MPIIEINYQHTVPRVDLSASEMSVTGSPAEADAPHWSQIITNTKAFPLGYKAFNCLKGETYPPIEGYPNSIDPDARDACEAVYGKAEIDRVTWNRGGIPVGKATSLSADQNGQNPEHGPIKKSEEGWIAILAALGLGSIIASFLSTRKRAGQSDS